MDESEIQRAAKDVYDADGRFVRITQENGKLEVTWNAGGNEHTPRWVCDMDGDDYLGRSVEEIADDIRELVS